MHQRLTRRVFLASVSLAFVVPQTRAQDRSRATAADPGSGGPWSRVLTVRVGGPGADIAGSSGRAIQAAVDYVAGLGGGIVELGPGEFRLRNAIRLRKGVVLRGHGERTLLTRGPSPVTPLAQDADWYDQEVTVADPSGFQVGDGVTFFARDPANGGNIVLRRTLVAQRGNTFKLDRPLEKNLWVRYDARMALLFSLVDGDHVENARIEGMVLDGNRDECLNLNGNYGAGIFLFRCRNIEIRNVVVRRFNGDGISFQTSHDVVVEDCRCVENADMGVHPGSGAQRPVIRGNELTGNRIGLFWCWGVKFGRAEKNRILRNRDVGISIGHNDTDNRMTDNLIEGNGRCGILFRDDPRGLDFWPHRNCVERNRLVDNGGPEEAALRLEGQVTDVKILGNTFVERRGAARRVAIRIGPEVGAVCLAQNQFHGFWKDVDDQRALGSREG